MPGQLKENYCSRTTAVAQSLNPHFPFPNRIDLSRTVKLCHLWSTELLCYLVLTRAGPPSQKWSDQQITVNPTGSIHKKARGKKFDPKKVDFDEGVLIWKKWAFYTLKTRPECPKNAKWPKIMFRGPNWVPKVSKWGFWGGIRSIKVVSEFWFGHPKCHFWHTPNG